MADSRKTLADEGTLLGSWATAGALLGENNQGIAADQVFSGWAQYFSRWSQLNADLSKLSNSEFNQELDNEIARLTKMRDALAGDNSDGAKFWVDMLNLDIANAQALKV